MVWLVVQPVRMPLVPGSCVNPGSVPISCSYKHSTGDHRATDDTKQVVNNRWDVERGSKRGGEGGGSSRDCGQVAREDHSQPARQTQKQRAGNDRILIINTDISALLVCQHLCQSDNTPFASPHKHNYQPKTDTVHTLSKYIS